jgi:hypothetical protein
MRRVARCQGYHERGRQLRRPYIFSEIQVLLPSKGKGHDWTKDDGIGKRFQRRVEHTLNVAVQGSHDANSRKHRWPSQFRYQHQAFNRGCHSGVNTKRLGRIGVPLGWHKSHLF